MLIAKRGRRVASDRASQKRNRFVRNRAAGEDRLRNIGGKGMGVRALFKWFPPRTDKSERVGLQDAVKGRRKLIWVFFSPMIQSPDGGGFLNA